MAIFVSFHSFTTVGGLQTNMTTALRIYCFDGNFLAILVLFVRRFYIYVQLIKVKTFRILQELNKINCGLIFF